TTDRGAAPGPTRPVRRRGAPRSRPARSRGISGGASRDSPSDLSRQLTVRVPAPVKIPAGLITWTWQAPDTPAGMVASSLSSACDTICAAFPQMRPSVTGARLQVENSVIVAPTLAVAGTKLSNPEHSALGSARQQKPRLFESPLITLPKKRPVRLLSWPSCTVRSGAQKEPLMAAWRPKLKSPGPATLTLICPQFCPAAGPKFESLLIATAPVTSMTVLASASVSVALPNWKSQKT